MSHYKGLLVLTCMSLTIMALGCTPGPEKTTKNFLSDLRAQKYADARRLLSPAVTEQITIIEKDQNALYNGQQWDYYDVTSKSAADTAVVNYSVKLNDSTKIEQSAVLAKSDQQWLIRSIKNVKISYSPGALKKRSYAVYGNQMLIAPLDIEYISKEKLRAHIGEFITVSGNLCEYRDQGNTLMMSMGADSSQPLLFVRMEGTAKVRAMQDHAKFLKTDRFVESAMGDTFTVTGLLGLTNGRYSMKITNPANIITGPFLRIESNRL